MSELDPRVCDPVYLCEVSWFRTIDGAGWTDRRLLVWGAGLYVPITMQLYDRTEVIGEQASRIIAMPEAADELDLRDLALFSLRRTPLDCGFVGTDEDDGLYVLSQDPCLVMGRAFDRRLISQMVAALAALGAGNRLAYTVREENDGWALWVGDANRRAVLMSLTSDTATYGLSFEETVRK